MRNNKVFVYTIERNGQYFWIAVNGERITPDLDSRDDCLATLRFIGKAPQKAPHP